MRYPCHLPLTTLVAFATFTACIAGAVPRLPRSTPEAQGVSSAALLDFVTTADAQIDTLNSFMLVRHGHVIAEGWWSPYTADDPHLLHSLSKSFTSTAVGLAIAEGRLSLDDPVLKYFPDDAPAKPDNNLRQMRVRDLLVMATGHHADAISRFPYNSPDPLVRMFLSWPVEHKPGTHFLYNSPGTYMQSAIVQNVTGENLVDYLRPRLFEPLGIGTPRWDSCPRGIALGTTGLFLRTEDIACFGQLYLQQGKWNGVQLVPTAWVAEATAKQISNGNDPASDSEQGYGYQFWRCRPGFYRADGAYGQLCIVMPEQDAVAVFTSGTRTAQSLMDLVWDRILPALGDTALAASPVDQDRLKRKLAGLSVRGVTGDATSPLAVKLSGRAYVFPANERNLTTLTLQVTNGQTSLLMRGEGIDSPPIIIGNGTWQRGGTTRFGSDLDPRARALREEPVAAIGGWETKDTFVAKICYYETAYILTVRLQFGGDLVAFDADYNVSFGSNAFPQLVGRAP